MVKNAIRNYIEKAINRKKKYKKSLIIQIIIFIFLSIIYFSVYNEKIDPTTTNLVQSISGKGTVTVKVYIDDVLKKTVQCNLNEESKFTIE